jgi:amidohydrolase
MLDAKLSRAVCEAVDGEARALIKLSLDIHANPELRFEEHKAAGWIAELVAARGHAVEKNVAGMATALRARAGQSTGPRVAILAEYDALPEIGHACGHNLIAAGAVGAFLAAAKVAEQAGGEVVLLGTPAEEGGGGKIKMIDAGVFDRIDAAMMFHPFDRDILAHPALASTQLAMSFEGKPAHAAAAPHAGSSALTACMDVFRLVDGQRVHFRDGVRVHGFITNGGQAVNIIPERAACEMSVRARDTNELDRVKAIVMRCANAAAAASDVKVTIQERRGYRDMVNNMTIARVFGEHLKSLGRTPRESDPRVGAGSTDMGDVSHVLPSIHPYLGVVDEGTTQIHEHAFANATRSDRAMQTVVCAAKAMALTAVELLVSPDVLAAAKEEWRNNASPER